MIIPPDKTDEKETPLAREEPPPSYADSETTLASDTQTPATEAPAAPQPCNFVSITRKNRSVKGPFVIDSSIYIPPAHLPPLQEDEKEEERKNLRLKTYHGSVDAEILLVGDGAEEGSRSSGAKRASRITLDLSADNGFVLAKVSAPDRRRPVRITASSRNGSVTLYLPRSFRGFLTLTTHNGTVVLSAQFSPNVTTLSDISGTLRCFVGDLSSWVNRDEGWEGDELIASSHNGRIMLAYLDEVPANGEKGRKGSLLNRVIKLF